MSMTTPALETSPARPASRQIPRWLAIILACIFAGLIPETVLTSSTSVVKILAEPITLVFISIYYGSAMLLFREWVIRRPASWVSVVLLGIAFGFCNEGVASGTWYTVAPQGFRFIGPVDITWAVGLTVFHIYISMLVTIAFTEVLLPAYAGQSLLGRRGMIIAALLFLITNLAFLLSGTFRVERLLALAAALGLVAIAMRVPPARRAPPRVRPVPRLGRLRVGGFLAYLLYFMCLYVIPAAIGGLGDGAQAIDIAIMLSFAILVLVVGRRWMQSDGRSAPSGPLPMAAWGVRQNLALITGMVAFMLPITAIIPAQRALLEPLATVPFFAYLLWRAGQLRRAAARVASVDGGMDVGGRVDVMT